MMLTRRRVAAYVADGLSSDRAHRLQQAAAWLQARHRTADVALLSRDVAELLSARGYLSATLTSAHQLTAGEIAAITAHLKTVTGAHEVELTSAVDPSLLGGLKITLPDRELDTTVTAKLHTLVTEMTR